MNIGLIRLYDTCSLKSITDKKNKKVIISGSCPTLVCWNHNSNREGTSEMIYFAATATLTTSIRLI